MSSNFEYRYVALTPEHTTGGTPRSYGTASAGASAKKYGEVDDESVAHAFELLTRADMSRYGAAKSVNGKEYSEGGINLVAQADDFLGLLLYGAYGDNLTFNSTNYTFATNIHTWSEANDHILPSFTMEIGREDKEHTYTGMCLSRLSISANVGEYAMVSADFNGKAESAVSALATPSFNGVALDGLHFANASVTLSSDDSNTTTINTVKSISVEWNMNLNTDDACSLGSRTYVRQPEPQMREITGSIEFSRPSLANSDETIDYEDVTASGGSLYAGGSTEPAINLFFNAGANGNLRIKIRKVRWEAPSMNVSGRDSSTMSLNFVALVDTADNVMSEVVLGVPAAITSARYSTL